MPVYRVHYRRSCSEGDRFSCRPAFLSVFIFVHGCARESFTDNGTHFIDHMMQEIQKLLDIKHVSTTSYHAQADGAAERAVKTFVNILSHLSPYLESP